MFVLSWFFETCTCDLLRSISNLDIRSRSFGDPGRSCYIWGDVARQDENNVIRSSVSLSY